MRIIVALALLAACDMSDFDPPDATQPPVGPGSPTWDDTDLSCGSSKDCAPGEACDGGQCRPKQCDDGPYESEAPLGKHNLLFREQELLVVDSTASQGAYWVDGYDAAAGINYSGPGGGSWSIGSSSLVDVSRIHMQTGSGVLAASAGSTRVTLVGRSFAKKQIDTGIVPVAVGAGDVDGDASDDIVALSASGQIAVCTQTGSCKRYNFGNGEQGIDVAVADVDADGLDDVLFLLRTGDQTTIVAWTVGASDVRAASFATRFDAITAGDIDHDGRAEVAVLEDGGWLGFASDRVHVYRVGAGYTGVVQVSTSSSAVDLGAGDLDGGDYGDAIVVLGDNKSIDVLRWNGSTVASVGTGSVGTTDSPRRLAVGDLDDDSVAARLVSGPDLLPGRIVPTILVTFPPYDSTVSDATAGVTVGSTTDMSESYSGTVSLSAGIEVGVDLDFVGLFKGHVGTGVSRSISRSHATSQSVSIGTSFSLNPQTELYGNQYAAVVVACNCFHTYTYEFVDPANHAGVGGRRMTVIVPAGGQTTVVSTPRYNALADATHQLPKITLTSRIGDPASYPRTPAKLDGTPVQPDEHVFATRPTLRTSDVGTVGFSLAVGSNETNSSSMSTTVSVSGSVSIPGMSLGASLGTSWGKSYSISIGQSSSFSGSIPPIADKPQTQEDEFATHGYSFTPYIYRQTYVDPVSNEQTGFYVFHYAVGAP